MGILSTIFGGGSSSAYGDFIYHFTDEISLLSASSIHCHSQSHAYCCGNLLFLIGNKPSDLYVFGGLIVIHGKRSHCLPSLLAAHGGLCGWRDQADSAWPPAILCEAEGHWEKPKALWPTGCIGIQSGLHNWGLAQGALNLEAWGLIKATGLETRRLMGISGVFRLTPSFSRAFTGSDICEVSAALHGISSASGWAELPSDCHSQGHVPGGKVSSARWLGQERQQQTKYQTQSIKHKCFFFQDGRWLIIVGVRCLEDDWGLCVVPNSRLEEHWSHPPFFY